MVCQRHDPGFCCLARDGGHIANVLPTFFGSRADENYFLDFTISQQMREIGVISQYDEKVSLYDEELSPYGEDVSPTMEIISTYVETISPTMEKLSPYVEKLFRHGAGQPSYILDSDSCVPALAAGLETSSTYVEMISPNREDVSPYGETFPSYREDSATTMETPPWMAAHLDFRQGHGQQSLKKRRKQWMAGTMDSPADVFPFSSEERAGVRTDVQSNSLAHRMGEGGRRPGEGKNFVFHARPHPGPLPRGEGMAIVRSGFSGACASNPAAWIFKRAVDVFPLSLEERAGVRTVV